MTTRETQEVSGEEEGSAVLQQGEEVERSESWSGEPRFESQMYSSGLSLPPLFQQKTG